MYTESCGGCFTAVSWNGFNKIHNDDQPYQINIVNKYDSYCKNPLKEYRIAPKNDMCYFIIAKIILDDGDNKNFYVTIQLYHLATNSTAPTIGDFKISLPLGGSHETDKKDINMISDSFIVLFKQKDLMNKFFRSDLTIQQYMAHMDVIHHLLDEYIATEIYQTSSDNIKFTVLKERIKQDNSFYQRYFEKKLDLLINCYDNTEDIDKKRGYREDILKFMDAHFMDKKEMTSDVSKLNKRLKPSSQMIGVFFLELKSTLRVDSESSPSKKKKLREKLIEEFLKKVRNIEEPVKPKSSMSASGGNNK